jgi:DNA-binding response OmpR family regulator
MPEPGLHVSPIVVAVINSNPDLVRLLRVNLEAAGFVVVIAHIEDIKTGAADLKAFLEEHDPRIIVYDVAPPYELNWRTLEHLRMDTDLRGRQFVLTTVNVSAVQRIVGTDETVYEVLGEQEDIAQVVRAVKEASRARPTR